MTTNTIEYFSFWQPIHFNLNNPGTTFASKLGFSIGVCADEFASLNGKTLSIKAERIDSEKLYFESEGFHDIPIKKSVLKIALLFFSGGTLLLIALAIKAMFKYHLNTCKVTTKKSPNEIFAEKIFGTTKITLLYGSLTEETTHAIVNAANKQLFAGSGVCGAIRKKAGRSPFKECANILTSLKRNGLPCGFSVLTSSGDLFPRVKAILHTVGPDFRVTAQKKRGKELLRETYWNSLFLAHFSSQCSQFVSEEAKETHIYSIAFPSISTGIFKAPLKESSQIALATIKEFTQNYPDAFEEIRLVFLPPDLDQKTGIAYKETLDELIP